MIKNGRKVSHPGVYVKDAIEELGLNQSEFALRSGISVKQVSTIITGESPITFEVAVKLAAFFQNSVEGWLNLQTKYNLYLNTKKREEEYLNDWEVAKLFDKNYSKKIFNVVVDSKNKEGTVDSFRRIFNVGTLQALKQPNMYAFCKTSVQKDLDERTIIMRNAWISFSELEARKMETTEAFNKDKILENVPFLRRLTLTKPSYFFGILRNFLLSCGVKLVILPYLPKSNVSGVTKWIANENCVLVAVNDCGKDADKIWFTIFHELGHAIKNHRRHLTISYSKDNIQDEEEIEANNFAKNSLINEKDYLAFVDKGKFDIGSISRFSKTQTVADFIVIGRLQKDGYVPWSMYQKEKIKYEVI